MTDYLTRLRAFQRELETEGSGLIYPFQVAYDPKIGAGAFALSTLASDLRALLEEREALREALTDMRAGWRYIRRYHGDLYGVGWDRCEQSADAALSMNSVSGELND